MIDLFEKNAVKFSQLEILILDEADRMLDMGFSDEIGKILALLPNKRQNLLFSATFSDDIRKLTSDLLKSPVKIEVNPRNSAAKSVKQWVYEVDKSKKAALLSHLIRSRDWSQVLVFVRTKNGVDQLVRHLKSENISAVAIHGDKSQGLRTRALADFKANKTRILVATDIAARGIDVADLSFVVHYNLPEKDEYYTHRSGRTARAGKDGISLSLVTSADVRQIRFFEKVLSAIMERRKSLLLKLLGEKGETINLVVFKEDVPQFVGSDGKTYGPFHKGDIARIPEDNAKLLMEKGLAEKLKVK